MWHLNISSVFEISKFKIAGLACNYRIFASCVHLDEMTQNAAFNQSLH